MSNSVKFGNFRQTRRFFTKAVFRYMVDFRDIDALSARLGVIIDYKNKIFAALYGADLASNYQGQGLKLSKHFKPVEG